MRCHFLDFYCWQAVQTMRLEWSESCLCEYQTYVRDIPVVHSSHEMSSAEHLPINRTNVLREIFTRKILGIHLEIAMQIYAYSYNSLDLLFGSWRRRRRWLDMKLVVSDVVQRMYFMGNFHSIIVYCNFMFANVWMETHGNQTLILRKWMAWKVFIRVAEFAEKYMLLNNDCTHFSLVESSVQPNAERTKRITG